jgi:predicted DNA-binding protein
VGSKYTEAQKKAAIKYMDEKTDNIQLRLPKGTKERWKAAADAAGVSMTQYVREAVEAAIAAEKPGK